VDGVHRMSVGDYASVVTRNGEPVQVAMAGDAMQGGPSTISKVNGRICGGKSILDVLKLHPKFFVRKQIG